MEDHNDDLVAPAVIKAAILGVLTGLALIGLGIGLGLL